MKESKPEKGHSPHGDRRLSAACAGVGQAVPPPATPDRCGVGREGGRVPAVLSCDFYGVVKTCRFLFEHLKVFILPLETNITNPMSTVFKQANVSQISGVERKQGKGVVQRKMPVGWGGGKRGY